MKKFLLYLTLFISVFIGVTSCVVVNGYNNYLKAKNEIDNTTTTTDDNTVLTSIASGVMNSTNYIGTISLTDTEGNTTVAGDFNYINNDSMSVEINLSGNLNNYNFNLNAYLIAGKIYISLNDIKLCVSTDDLTSALKEVMEVINQNAGITSSFDINNAQDLLSNITTTEFENGYCVTAKIPELCDIYVVTNSEYLPSQIIVTNLKLNENKYTLKIYGETTEKNISPINLNEYFEIGELCSYIKPAINTFNISNLGISGTIELNGSKITINAIKTSNNNLIGKLNYNNLDVNFELKDGYGLISYNNIKLKFNYSEINELLNLFVDTNTVSGSTININDLLSNLTIDTTIKNEKITNIVINHKTLTLDLSFAKSFKTYNPISEDGALSVTDVKNTVYYFSNLYTNKFSVNISANIKNVPAYGRLYIETATDYSKITSIVFDGYINNLPAYINFNDKLCLVNINNNKVKLQNASVLKLLDTIKSLVPQFDFSSINNEFNLESIIENVKLNNNVIEYSDGKLSAKLISYNTEFKLTIATEYGKISATILPNETCYNKQLTNDVINDYNNFDELPSLINATTNTLNQDTIQFSGNINIKLKDFNYRNIGISILRIKKTGEVKITLSNLPTDFILTYVNPIYYKNQKCVLTILNNKISIYTTIEHRITGRITTICNKTINASELSVNNLYDILSMRKSIIKIMDTTSANEKFNTNLSTDLIKIYNDYSTIDLKTIASNVFTNATIQFNYDTKIKSIIANLCIKNFIYINISLS